MLTSKVRTLRSYLHILLGTLIFFEFIILVIVFYLSLRHKPIFIQQRSINNQLDSNLIVNNTKLKVKLIASSDNNAHSRIKSLTTEPISPVGHVQSTVESEDDQSASTTTQTIPRIISGQIPHIGNNFSVVTPEISKIYDRLKQVESRPLRSSFGKTWKKDTFCSNFLSNTFDEAVPVCGNEIKPDHSIRCFGSRYDPVSMGTCVYENVAINPSHFSATKPIDCEGKPIKINDTVVLLNDQNTSCLNPSAHLFKKRTGSYQTRLLEHVVANQQRTSSICKHWIDQLTFLFSCSRFHIYFRFLDYYNLHKSLWDYNVTSGNFLVLQMSDVNKTRFHLETDRKFFPEIISLQDLPNDTVCFKKIVTVPCCFESVLFRCKMNSNIKSKCFSCNGNNLSGTSFETFRQRVLQSCSANNDSANTDPQFGIISRVPYERFPKDKPRKFQRVLSNEKDLVEELQAAYPTANVSVIHPEQYGVCDQVRYAHKVNVLMGVHGAGMVHVWWLKNDALGLELEPKYESGNPTFKMLSMLTGRRYKSVSVNGTKAQVSVDINTVLNKIKKNIHFPAHISECHNC